jgi:hypothetical protein
LDLNVFQKYKLDNIEKLLFNLEYLSSGYVTELLKEDFEVSVYPAEGGDI